MKHTWTESEKEIFGKLIGDADIDITGSKAGEPVSKDEDMLKRQEAIMDKINKGRLDMKGDRE